MSIVNATGISYTPAIIAGQMISDLNANQSEQATLEEQLGTGNLVNSPSDNPAAASAIMQLNSGLARAQQYAANASDGLGWLSLGTSTLNQVLSSLQSVRQQVVGLSSAFIDGGQPALNAISSQIDSARQQLINLANTTYGGQAIFAGTGSVAQAYDSNGNYMGGGSAPTRTVAPHAAVAVAATGPDVFGSGTSGLLGSTGVLAQLSSDVVTGTSTSLQQAETTDLSNLDAAISQVEAQAAQLGANYQQMQGFSQQATNSQAALQSQLSGMDSINMAQTTTDLTQAQQSYQAALWATAQIEQQSLVHYLG